MRIVINKCFGGFGLSDAAYEKLIEWGVPVRAYVQQKQNERGLYLPEPQNDGEVVFDRTLSPGESVAFGRYWETWTDGSRTHPLVLRVVEELGDAANGDFAQLCIVEVPDGIEWEIDEYDGNERIAETHRTWS